MIIPSTLAATPSVSLLLPTYNADHILDHVLERLAVNTTYRDVEVVAVDDGSTDASLAILRRWAASGRFPAFQLITKPNGGAIETLNTALEAARGDVIVQLDADASVESSGWLQTMLSLMLTDDRVGVVTTKVVMDSGYLHACGVDLVAPSGMRDRPSRLLEPVGRRTWHFRVERMLEGTVPAVEDVLAEVDSGLGCCLMYRRADAIAAGGYDTGYSPVWFDDIDLCLSIRRLGRKVFFLPDVRVIHHVHGRAGQQAVTVGARARQAVKRRIPATRRLRHRWRRDNDEGFSPEQRDRLLRHHAHWFDKWGWHPLNPDMREINRTWGETELCWQLSPERRAAGQEIISAFSGSSA